jgi:cytochrome oxidase Cu insertion factor (SCO1/SenC/PrrC family)
VSTNRRLAVPVALLAVVVAVLVMTRTGALSGRQLGPVDGHDLPPTDLDRVVVGDTAPDFSLEALSGDMYKLSGFRGVKNVVLVFYRGHW